MNVHLPVRGLAARVLPDRRGDAGDRGRRGVVLPQARLAMTEGVEALEGSDRPKRMLVIINPVATKMSDRVKSLVVYALQGRYDVTTTRDRGQGPRDRALPQGGGRAATTSSSPSAATGRSTRPPTAWPARAPRSARLPGGSNNVVAKLLGIPTDLVDATEQLLHVADRWADARRSISGWSTAATSRSRPASGSTPAWSSAWTATRRLKKRFGPFYFVECAIVTFLRTLRRQPAAAVGRGRRAHGRRRVAVRPERRQLHVLQGPPGPAGRRRALRLRLPGRRRARPARAPTTSRPSPSARCRAPRGSPSTAASTRSARSARPSCARPTAARSRSRSTATTSPTSSRRASPSRPAALTVVA